MCDTHNPRTLGCLLKKDGRTNKFHRQSLILLSGHKVLLCHFGTSLVESVHWKTHWNQNGHSIDMSLSILILGSFIYHQALLSERKLQNRKDSFLNYSPIPSSAFHSALITIMYTNWTIGCIWNWKCFLCNTYSPLDLLQPSLITSLAFYKQYWNSSIYYLAS